MIKLPMSRARPSRPRPIGKKLGSNVSLTTPARRLPIGPLPPIRPRRILLLVALLVAGLAGGYFGFNRWQESQAPQPISGQAVRVQRGTVTATVSATGNVAPLAQARLSFKSSGTIEQVLVKPGDQVVAGQPLITLDTRDLELTVRDRELALESAQTKLDQTLAGGRPEDIAAAQANLDSAQTKLRAVQNGPSAADVQSAESSVISARSNLEKARNDLAKLTTPLSPQDLAQTASAVEKARSALVKAQSDYDKVAWRGDIGSRPEAAALADATADYKSAVAAYELKQQPPSAEDVSSAQQTVASAQASLDTALANLDKVRAGALPEDIAAAQSAVTQAQTNLALKRAPYTAADVQAARIAVQQAQNTLATAQLNVQNATVIAPFDGVVSTVSVAPGELTSSASGAAIVLVDPSSLRVDVAVDESDISKVRVGERAQITFDSLGTRQYSGTVLAVAPAAAIQSGVATYQVSVSVDNPQGALSGMTGSVSIIYEQRDDVLLLPNRAIRTVGRSRVVDILEADGTTRQQVVQTGVANDQNTEIVSGVVDGDQVLIRSTTTRPTNVPGGAVPVLKPGR